jgi:hypothetical protein
MKEIENLNYDIITELIQKLPDNNTLSYEVCIITKGNRKPSILENLDTFENTKINVFIYEYEKELYSWLDKPNVNKIYVPFTPEQSNVAVKRRFVQETMGRKRYWVFDDDIKNGIIAGDFREGKTTRLKIKTSVSKMCKILETVIQDEKNWTMAGYAFTEICVAFCTYKNLVSHDNRIDGVFLFDGKTMIDNNIWYAGDPTIIESFDVYLQSLRAGLNSLCCPFGTWEYLHKTCGKQSIASTPYKRIRMLAGTYLKYGNIISFKKRTDEQKIQEVVYYSKIKDPITWNDKLLNICKQVAITGDAQPIVDYLDNAKRKNTRKCF